MEQEIAQSHCQRLVEEDQCEQEVQITDVGFIVTGASGLKVVTMVRLSSV